ncbi:hypothetical protein PROFUN_15273, partial [Planoprotostelium fungivorum]
DKEGPNTGTQRPDKGVWRTTQLLERPKRKKDKTSISSSYVQIATDHVGWTAPKNHFAPRDTCYLSSQQTSTTTSRESKSSQRENLYCPKRSIQARERSNSAGIHVGNVSEVLRPRRMIKKSDDCWLLPMWKT